MMVLSYLMHVYDAEDQTVIRLRACEGRAAPGVRAAAAALVLTILVAVGCGPDGEAGQPGGTAPRGSSTTPPMTAEAYVAHMAALTIALEEGLSGQDAASRAIELGSRGHSREEVERFALTLRSRPETWVEIEKAVDKRIVELRGTPGGRIGGAEER
jgi:hypothetical protein